MKPIKKIFFHVLASILGFASCQKDDTLYYSNVTMGNIVNGAFISDQGNRFNIKEQTCTGILDTVKRAMIVCDVLSKTGEATYDIRLNGFSSVLTKAIVNSTAVTDPEILTEDPLMVYEMWYAGGYINMLLRFHLPKSSTKQHMVNLVYSSSEAGKYTFSLRHNAFGESVTANDTDIIVAQSYVSFPISSVIKEDKASITLNWKWFKANGYIWANEINEYSAVYEWTRDSFEQASTVQ